MDEPEKKLNGQVNAEKAKLSPQYENWYEATPENPEMEYRIRLLKEEIFDGKISSSGREFSNILFTTEELAEQGKYTLKQEDVTEYDSKEAFKRRERSLDKGPLFEPKVVLENIIPSSQRENREEGLNRPSYGKSIQREVVKHLITSGCSVIDALSLMAKAAQLATEEEWITQEEWIGPNRLEDEEIDVKLAKEYAKILKIDLDELLIHQQRVERINPSAPTYINSHDQHLVPSSQGGLSQRPVSIVSHWFEHSLLANDSGEALLILLGEKELGEVVDQEALDKLIELSFFAYQINSQAAELLRASIPLSPSLSTKYILERRKGVCQDASEILNKTIALDQNNHLDLLSEKDKKNILSLAQRMGEKRGNLFEENELEEDEEPLSLDEFLALEKLELAVELIDRDSATNRLKASLDSLRRIGKSRIEKAEIEAIITLIGKLEKGHRALYLHYMTEEEYKAVLSLQEALDENILIDILVPTKIKNIRPSWRYRLDLEVMGDVLVNPYDDKGLDIRMLLDVLQEPIFNRVFLTGAPPRRDIFTEEQLLDPYISDKVYGDLRYVKVLEALVANNILGKYYESLGIKNKSEILDILFPEDSKEEPPSALQNVDRAAGIVYKAVVEDKRIATIGDCDQDGFFASINWRWALEHVGVKEISQKFNTRLEGHAVQPVDLLNLAIEGNQLIIINDTGSSQQDTNTFSFIREGIRSLDDLIFFRDNMDAIKGYENLSKHERTQIKTKLTRFINENDSQEDIDRENLLNISFTTGKKYKDEYGNIVPEYKTLGSFESLAKFVSGFNDIQIIVCDHHTPSIEAIEFFKDNNDVIMVNPEWVRQGYEEIFIEEMKLALKPNKNGEVNIEKVNEVQRKYICYPESDIVGTVTAGKVIKRFLQLLTDDEIVRTEDEGLYSLNHEERRNKYNELARKVSGIDLHHQEEEPEGLPTNITLTLAREKGLKIFIGDLWLKRDSLNKIESRLSQVVNALAWRIEEIKGSNEEEGIELLSDLEEKFGVTIASKETLIDLIHENSFYLDKDSLGQDLKGRIEKIYRKRISDIERTSTLTKGELRFYLEYAGQLPKSFYLMTTEEKKEYVRGSLLKLSHEIDRVSYSEDHEDIVGTDLHSVVQEMVAEGKDLRDLKKILFDMIEEAYQDDEDGAPVKREKVRYEGNKLWKKAMDNLRQEGILSQMGHRVLKSYFNYGPFGLEFLELTEATATLGDGGSVGLVDGLENRSIVKKGMESIEKFVDAYWIADALEKKDLKRIQPEILRLIRTSLRGTHIKSVNWNLSRLLTHGVSAFVNAMYRRGKEERSQRAKEFWTEASDFCTKRSDTETTRRHRHTLVHAQEVAIERREELFEEIVKDLESDHGEIDRPIIITKLEGRKYVDPTKGFRGLIAGQLAGRYNKPVMVVVEEKAPVNGNPNQYSVSFRLPAKGNVAADMVQLGLAINQVPGIKILAHGGHPEAAGGTWVVQGGIERIHEVLDPIFSKYKIENPDAGIVRIEKVIEETVAKLEDEDWDGLEDYSEYVNAFDIADTIASNMYKQTNPYGVDMPGLLLEFEDLTVVSRSSGVKNDGNEYCNLIVRDKRGNVRAMRLFKNLADFAKIQKGDTVTLRAQPIMRLRALEEGNLQYKWPLPDNTDERIEVNTVVGQKSRPKLDIEKIVSIRRNH
jgi:single-stranded DNA-specific DHH superfamily exonuclease